MTGALGKSRLRWVGFSLLATCVLGVGFLSLGKSGVQEATEAKQSLRAPEPLSPEEWKTALVTGIHQAVTRAGSELDEEGALALTRAYFPELSGASSENLPEGAMRSLPRATHPLTVVPPEDPRGALVVSARGLTFHIHRVGAGWPTEKSGGARFNSPNHLLAPAGEWAAVGRGWMAQRVEEYAIQSPGEPYVAVYDLALPPAVTRIHDAGGYLELCAEDRTPVLRFHRAVARDAEGTTRTGTLAVAGLAPGGWARVSQTLRVRTEVETHGLIGPVVVDPGWSSTGSMANGRSEATATLLPAGRVLVAGGWDGNGHLASAELYDPSTGTWSATGTMGNARFRATATLLPSGLVLVAGGSIGATAELYDPASGTWSGTGSMATARLQATATLLPSGGVLVAGGDNRGSLASAELYDPSSRTWSETGSMATARAQATATLLPSGHVLVAGGEDGTFWATAELYNPSSGTWSETGSLATRRYAATATLLSSGEVLVAGGSGGASGSALQSAELYDPSSETWSETGALATGRHNATATLLPSGRVLAAGGAGTSVELYDPVSGSWLAVGPMTSRRSSATATLLPSGKVLLVGGLGLGEYLSSSELYDPHFGTWAGTGVLATARESPTTTLLPSGKVLVAGGLGGGGYRASAELYDPSIGAWTETGSMATPRYLANATLLPSGKVLVAGGLGAGGNLASAELYDPSSGIWSQTGALATGRGLATAILLRSGKVLVVGGQGAGGELASAELYDPSSGTWSVTGALATPRKNATATLLPSGEVLVAGGKGASGELASVELYDPASGTWSETGALAAAREKATATLLPSGKVLVAGGSGPGGYLTSAELYDPSSGAWSATGPMFDGRREATATLLPSGRVLVVGGYDGAGLASAELYDPASGIWWEAGALATARYHATATLLPTGKVLVVGGYAAGIGFLATGELFELTSGAWSATGSMVLPRATATATLLPSGKVLLAGGTDRDTSGGDQASAELYDPLTGTWSATGSMAFTRREATATLLPSGKVLVAAGRPPTGAPRASAELYDPSTGTWSLTGSMAFGRNLATATLLPTGKVLVAGGSGGSSGSLASAELYDPSTGTWMETGSMIQAVQRATATLLPSGKVLVVVWDSPDATMVQLYDPASGSWSLAAPLGTARRLFTATLLPSGKVLVAGGVDPGGIRTTVAELYDPSTGGWSPTGTMHTGRVNATATLLPSGKVLVAGGGVCCEIHTSTAAAELYDPSTGTWSATTSLAAARTIAYSVLLPSGKVLVTGGYNNVDVLAAAELYDETAAEEPWRPVVSNSSLVVGRPQIVSGSGFRGVSGASSGGIGDSPTDFPIVSLQSIREGGTPVVLPGYDFSATAVTVDVPGSLPAGPYMLTVTVNAISAGTAVNVVENAPPVAADQSLSVVANHLLSVTLTATDEQSDPITYSLLTEPAHGTLAGTPPNLTYTPAANYQGADAFTFQTHDGTLDSNVATVSITVEGTAPVSESQSVSVVANHSLLITLTANDAEADPLTYAVLSGPEHGTLSGTAPELTYTPVANYHGTDAFSFRTHDGTRDSQVATVTITVEDTAPVAVDQTVATDADTAVSLTLAASDAEGDPLTYAVVGAPAHGALSGTAPDLTYTSSAGYRGTDSFTFRANDGTLDSNLATVFITVRDSGGNGPSETPQGCACSSNGPVSAASYFVPLSLVVLGLARRRRYPTVRQLRAITRG